MKKILVTGGSGKAGRATIKTLLENNYDVFNVDLEKSTDDNTPFTCVDLENFGETMEAITQIDDRIHGIDAIIHQAAIPASGLYPNHKTFRINTLSTYNVFQCAEAMKVQAKDCLVFEDGQPGIDAAIEAGMQSIDIRKITPSTDYSSLL